MPTSIQNRRGLESSPDIYGPVVEDTFFTHSGDVYIARGLWASADGTVGVTLEDGTTLATKLIFKGMNIFRCSKVQDLNGVTVEWFA